MENSEKIFNTIVQNDEKASLHAFSEGIRSKLDDALEVRKVGLTSTIFNKTEEKTEE